MNGYTKYRMYGSDIHIFEFNQRKVEPRPAIGVPNKLEPLSKLNPVLQPGEVVLAKINATFFDPKSKREILGKDAQGWTQVIYGKDTVMRLFDPPRYGVVSPLEQTDLWTLPASYTLMVDGKIDIHNTGAFPHYVQRHPRTIIGQRKNLNMIFIVIDGRRRLTQKGMTAVEEAEFCRYYGLYNAVNFDGGGSSEMIIRLPNGKYKIVNRPSDGYERSIGAALCAVGRI